MSTLVFAAMAAGGVVFAVCTDNDGDGYGNPGSSDCPAGAQTDCNDTPGTGAAINPGADELCGDGIDNDCNPATDFDAMIGDMCVKATDPPTCTCTDPMNCPDIQTTGCCFTGGMYECSGDLLGLECHLLGEITMQEPEGETPGDASCTDMKDNDCDDLFDFAEPSCRLPMELCNGFDDDASGRESGASTGYDCSDFKDNDNDGMIDLEDPDCQAGVDDDAAFADLGSSCIAGIGECRRTGVKVCSDDGMTTVCDARPGNMVTEGPPGGARCNDGLDNDCDGATDLSDSTSCQAVEVCDGLDNDGNDGADEDFQPAVLGTTGLGQPCLAGMGACEVEGHYVCKTDGSGTECDAVAKLPNTEGPIGDTCEDLIDNDCDGMTDDMDNGCLDEITVTCALPHGLGKNGGGCNGYHRVEYEVLGASTDAEIVAELLALDVDGSILDIRPVRMGELAHLSSRVNPDSWKWVTRPNKRAGGPLRGPLGGAQMMGDGDNWHQVTAPIPVLRVTVEDRGLKSQAFCSSIPYLQVIEPNGDIVSSSEGDTTHVLAAVPLVDEGELSILVDGVDILAEMGIDPAAAFPGTVAGGPAMIGGHSVTISDITVDTTDDYEVHSSNTVRFSMTEMGCGGHVVWIEGAQVPGGLREPHSAECHEDDFDDKGFSSVFSVEITTPSPMQVTDAIPTPVMGTVCHGLPITAVQVNGKELDISGQSMLEGDGCTSADTYTYDIDTTLPLTDLANDVAGLTTELGTFDPGSNRLFVVAQDSKANRSSASHIFAVGPVIPPTFLTDPAATTSQLGRAPVDNTIQFGPTGGPTSSLLGTVQTDAFVIGLDPNALDTFFAESCKAASEASKTAVTESLVGMKFSKRWSDGCEPVVTTTIKSLTFDGDPRCYTVLEDPPAGQRERLAADSPPTEHPASTDPNDCSDEIDNDMDGMTDLADPDCQISTDDCLDGIDNDMDGVTDLADPGCQTDSGLLSLVVEMPPITIATHSYGHCHGDLWAVNLTVDFDTEFTFPDPNSPPDPNAPLRFEFDFNEDNIVNAGLVPARFHPPGDVDVTKFINRSSAGGWLGSLPGLIEAILNGLVFVFTFGQVDGVFDLTPSLHVAGNLDLRGILEVDDFSIKLQEIKVDEEEVTETDKLLSANLDYADIGSQGLMLSLRGVFNSISNDPEITDTPGFSPTPAPAPMPPQSDRNAFVVVSDDALNQLFASMSEQGEMKTECFGSNDAPTVGSLLPPDCATLEVPGDVGATAVVQGICLGLKAADINESDRDGSRAICETLMTTVADDPSRDLMRIGQGVCHGIRPAIENCNFIPGGLLEKITCQETPDFNLKASDPVLYCMRQENPPPLLIDDQDSADEAVDAILRMNDLLAGIIIDRDGNGTPASELNTLQGCFEEGADTAGDCKALALCMDMNLETTLVLNTDSGVPQLVPGVGRLVVGNRPEGAPCEGGVNFGTDDGSLDGAMDSDALMIDLFNNINNGTPPMEPKGLDLGGIVFFDNPRLIAIETGFDGDFRDYVGIAGNIVPPITLAPQDEVPVLDRPTLSPPQSGDTVEGGGGGDKDEKPVATEGSE